MSNKQLVLVSFADTRYEASLQRLEQETRDFPFTHRYFYTEQDLDEDFRKKLPYKRHPRGYGYWKWKAYLVKKVLEELSEGDMVVWSDSGNHFNIQGLSRFDEYLHVLVDSEGVLAFEQPYLERQYCKGDLLQYLGVYHKKEWVDSCQLWAGCFFLVKNARIVQLVDKWFDIVNFHYDLITDKRSSIPNYPDFIEHRHDQSVFSLLAKQVNASLLPYEECFAIDGNWSKLETSPIQARRDIGTGHKKISYYFSLPYKILRGWYLVKIEKMFFYHRYWW